MTFPLNENRPAGMRPGGLIYVCSVLLGSADGAGFRAGAAVDALFSVDFVLAVAFGNGFDGALGRASAASDAGVSNFVCHVDFLLHVLRLIDCVSVRLIYHFPTKNARDFSKMFTITGFPADAVFF